MLVTLIPEPVLQFFDSHGTPPANGKIFSYHAGTNNFQASYRDSTGTGRNTNSVILDFPDRAQIRLAQLSYKLVLQNSAGQQIWSTDTVKSAALKATVELLSGKNIWSGTNTWNGDSTFDGSNNTFTTGLTVLGGLTAAQINNTITVDGTAYPTLAAALAATRSGGTIIVPPNTTLTSGTISITASNTRILCSGPTSVIAQQSANSSQIVIPTGLSNISIEDCTFQGVSGTNRVNSNFAIKATNATNVQIINNTFTGWQQDAINCQGCNDLLIEGNRMFDLWGGILIQGGKHVRLIGNYLEQDPTSQNTVFVIPIQFDSTTGGFGAVSDATVSANIVNGYVNSQCILFHSGSTISITGNTCNNVLNGIVLGPLLGTGEDNISDANITGNTVVGTLTTGAGAIANQGIALNGLSGGTINHIVVSGNTVEQFNGVVKSDTQGAIQLNWVDDVAIVGNTIRKPYGNGINIAATATRLNIRRNNIEDVQFAATVQTGIEVQSRATVSGKIEGNSIDSTNDGLRFDSKNPNLFVGPNDVTNFTNSKVNNPGNATAFRARRVQGPLTACRSLRMTGGSSNSKSTPSKHRRHACRRSCQSFGQTVRPR
jgi:hypothetical protein